LDVSIIIVNYNTKELLRNCLASIFEYTRNISFEVIIVDNGSIDDSVEMIKSEFPQVKLIENKNNLGFGTANNLGAKIASGDYIFFLNSDTIFKNNALFLFYDYAQRNNKLLLGGYLLDKNNNIIHCYENYSKLIITLIRLLYNSYPFFLKIKKLFIKKRQLQPIISSRMVNYITGADLFIKKYLFYELGGFDENFFMYFEDDDLCKRAKELGYDSFVITGPDIVHYEGASLPIKSKKLKSQENSFLYYLNKHNSRKKYISFKPLLLIYVFFSFFSPYRPFRDKCELLFKVIHA